MIGYGEIARICLAGRIYANEQKSPTHTKLVDEIEGVLTFCNQKNSGEKIRELPSIIIINV